MPRAKPWQRFTGSGGRDLALAALAEASRHKGYVRDICEKLATARAATTGDRALALELALGAVRHQLTLDRLVGRFFTGRLDSLRPALRHVLRIGTYQLVFLDRVPDFAAVNEAVNQGRRIGGRKAGAMINAVLRELIRHRAERGIEWTDSDDPSVVRVDALQACRFREPVLPDVASDSVAFLSAATSHPTSLVKRWIAQFGMPRARAALWCGVMRPPLVLRPNRLRCDAAELLAALQRDGVEAAAEGDAVVVDDAAPPLRRLDVFRRGLCQPQDRTAMAPVDVLCAPGPRRILDLCAGSGTKATQAAEQGGERVEIVASDSNTDRLRRTESNCRRLGIRSVRAVPADQLDADVARRGAFDAILVDAPCSNSGVFSRRPEARYRMTDATLATLSGVQLSLLSRAAELVRPGGSVVYCTCSLEPEENEQVMERFVHAQSGWRLARSDRIFPNCGPPRSVWCDGGFWAELIAPR